jgi:hypothetical protein
MLMFSNETYEALCYEWWLPCQAAATQDIPCCP